MERLEVPIDWLLAHGYYRRSWKQKVMVAMLLDLLFASLVVGTWVLGIFDVVIILALSMAFLWCFWFSSQAWELFVNRHVWGKIKSVGFSHSTTGVSSSELRWVPVTRTDLFMDGFDLHR